MSEEARKRLVAERKKFRQEKPYKFHAKPIKKKDGSVDIFNWECGIPGKKDTIYEGATVIVMIHFPQSFPSNPPQCVFKPVLYHPNIYTDGLVCLDIVNPHGTWKPTYSIKDILLGLQALLTEPNTEDPANVNANQKYLKNRKEYDRIVKKQLKELQD